MESVVNRQSDNGIALASEARRRSPTAAVGHVGHSKGWWKCQHDVAQYCLLGGRSSVGRAPVCGTGGRGFEPRRSPQVAGGGRCFVPYTAAAPSRRGDAPLAQRQSNGLLIRRFWVRNPGGAPRMGRSETISDRQSPVGWWGFRRDAWCCSGAGCDAGGWAGVSVARGVEVRQ